MDQPLVKYFGSRPDGSLTPLVPVDELPDHISIRGVPPRLSIEQSYGMTCLSISDQRPVPFVVDIRNVPATRAPNNAWHASCQHGVHTLNTHGDDIVIHTHNRMNPNHPQVPQLGPGAWNAFAAAGAAGEADAIDVFRGGPATSIARPATRPATAPGARPSNGKKVFCSYWIRHGECDYEQQGCLYKHEMPLDRETLETLGLRDVPRWYREKYHVPSLIENRPPLRIDSGRPVRQFQYPRRMIMSGASRIASASTRPGVSAPARAPRHETTYPTNRRSVLPTQTPTRVEAQNTPAARNVAPQQYLNENVPVTDDLLFFNDSTSEVSTTGHEMGQVVEVDEETEDPIKIEYNCRTRVPELEK